MRVSAKERGREKAYVCVCVCVCVCVYERKRVRERGEFVSLWISNNEAGDLSPPIHQSSRTKGILKQYKCERRKAG